MSAPLPPATLDVRDIGRCPRCATALAGYEDEPPWCPSCEWNLDAFQPAFGREGMFGRLDRRAHAIGFREGPLLVEELAHHEVVKPGHTRAHLLLVVVSAILFLGTAAAMAGGVWLVTRLQPVEFFGGLLLFGLGFTLRPRLGSRRNLVKNAWTPSRDRNPALYALIDRIATEVGAPPPQTILFIEDWNLFVTQTGLRRHRTLAVGLPLFMSARPDERIALLGHELGHFVNGDVRSGLLTQPALTTLGRLAAMTWRPLPETVSDFSDAIAMVNALLLRPISFVLLSAHLYLTHLGSQESRRAEHYADALAARAGGTAATQSAMDLLLFGAELVKVVIGSANRGGGAEQWRSTVEGARRTRADRIDLLRQLSLRWDASAFASHPATALRYRLLGSTPRRHAAVRPADAEWERIDREMIPYVVAYGRHIKDTAHLRGLA